MNFFRTCLKSNKIPKLVTHKFNDQLFRGTLDEQSFHRFLVQDIYFLEKGAQYWGSLANDFSDPFIRNYCLRRSDKNILTKDRILADFLPNDLFYGVKGAAYLEYINHLEDSSSLAPNIRFYSLIPCYLSYIVIGGNLHSNRLLSKVASGREFEGESEHRTAVYSNVHEDSSTESTDKLPAEVELRNKSNMVPAKLYKQWIEFQYSDNKNLEELEKIMNRLASPLFLRKKMLKVFEESLEHEGKFFDEAVADNNNMQTQEISKTRAVIPENSEKQKNTYNEKKELDHYDKFAKDLISYYFSWIYNPYLPTDIRDYFLNSAPMKSLIETIMISYLLFTNSLSVGNYNIGIHRQEEKIRFFEDSPDEPINMSMILDEDSPLSALGSILYQPHYKNL